MAGLSAEKRRVEAEIAVAGYESDVRAYLDKGEIGVEDNIDRQRRRVAEVLDKAKQTGADVDDLIGQWMNISNEVIQAKKSLHE